MVVLAGNTYISNSSTQTSSELASLRNDQVDTVSKMNQALSHLMLAAMDSIIDKDEGKVEGERLTAINSNIAFINKNLDGLAELADTAEEKKLAETMKTVFPKLAKEIQQDLINLIEGSAVEVQKIQADFVKLDDTLDSYGDPIEENLVKIFSSVQAEQNEASEDQASAISRATTVGLAAFVIILAIILPVFFLISRSITKPLTLAINNLTEGSNRVASASGQVSSSSRQLAEGASEQAAALEETSSSLEEMSSMTRQNADNAEQADSLMKDASVIVVRPTNPCPM